jgi:hypothetical protein
VQPPIYALCTEVGDNHQDYIAVRRAMLYPITPLSGGYRENSTKGLYALRTNYRIRQFPQTVLKFLHPAEQDSKS